MALFTFKHSLPLHVEIKAAHRIQAATLLPSSTGFTCQVQGNPSDTLLSQIHTFLEGYLKGETLAPPPLDWTQLTPFTQKVLELLAKIPFGQSSTYGEVAQLADCPRGARAVGGACGRNPFLLFIPCHRVLGSHTGSCRFGGFTGGLPIKKTLLDFERIDY